MTSSYRLVINIQSSRKLPPRKDGTNLRPFVAITVNGVRIFEEFLIHSIDSENLPYSYGEWCKRELAAYVNNRRRGVSIGYLSCIHPSIRWGNVVSLLIDNWKTYQVVQKLPQDNRLVNTRHEESLHNILGSSEVRKIKDHTDSLSRFVLRPSSHDRKLMHSSSSNLPFSHPVTSSFNQKFLYGYILFSVNETIPSYLKVLIALEPATVLPSYTFPSQYLGEPKEVRFFDPSESGR